MNNAPYPNTQYPNVQYPNAAQYPKPPGYADASQYPQMTAYPTPQSPQASQIGYNQQPNVEFAPGTGPVAARKPQAAEHHEVNMFNEMSFSNKTIRRGFIKKVYLILFAQLMVTFGCVLLFTLVKPIQHFVQRTPGGAIFYYVSYGTFFVTYFVLVCVPTVRRKYPGNLICLGVFTLVFSYMVATISSFYTTKSVMVAAGITCAVCLAITLFALQTKIDFTMCSGLLFALVMVLIFFGFSCMIVYLTIGYNRILDCVYGGLAALVFSLFLIYDTQMIVGGRKHQLDPEEYVYGALQVYIDVVYLFLIILALFGKSN